MCCACGAVPLSEEGVLSPHLEPCGQEEGQAKGLLSGTVLQTVCGSAAGRAQSLGSCSVVDFGRQKSSNDGVAR